MTEAEIIHAVDTIDDHVKAYIAAETPSGNDAATELREAIVEQIALLRHTERREDVAEVMRRVRSRHPNARYGPGPLLAILLM